MMMIMILTIIVLFIMIITMMMIRYNDVYLYIFSTSYYIISDISIADFFSIEHRSLFYSS